MLLITEFALISWLKGQDFETGQFQLWGKWGNSKAAKE